MNHPQPVTTDHVPLPGEATATIVTVPDLESIDRAVRLTVPDEPMTASTILDLADALRGLAAQIMGRAL